MTNLTDNPVYEAGIYQLETTDPVLGGPPGFSLGEPVTGHANAQAQQLANRTAYLKERINVDLLDDSDPAKGAGMVGYRGRTQYQKNDDVFAVADYASIQAAIDAAFAKGGGWVILPPDSQITAPLDLKSGVRLVGQAGGGQYPAPGFATSANFLATVKTRIRAGVGFPSGQPMVSIRTAPDIPYAVQSAAITGVMLDCNAIADRGLDLVSAKHCRISDVLVYRPLVLGVLTDVLPVADATTEGNNATQFNSIKDLTVWLDATSAVGIRCTGTATHNTNQNEWDGIKVVHLDGVGIDLVNCDADNWYNVNTVSLGAGVGCVFNGGATAAESCRNLKMFGMEFAKSGPGVGGCLATFVGGGVGANFIKLYGYSTGNSAPLPTIQNGARLNFSPDLYEYQSDPVECRHHLDRTADWSNGAALGGYIWRARLTGASAYTNVAHTYARMQGGIGAEVCRLEWQTYQTGALALRMFLGQGLVLGAPTGGDKGTGSLNAQAVYDDNVLLTDYVFDKLIDGEVRPEDGEIAQKFDPSRLDINSYSSYWRENRHLPAMPSREQWREGKLSTGEMIQRLWETVEVQAVHIESLNQRLMQLEPTNQ